MRHSKDRFRQGIVLSVVFLLFAAPSAFALSGRAEFAFRSSGYCVGDSWSLSVMALGSPSTEIRLAGIFNGKNWEEVVVTDDVGAFSRAGVFGANAIGRHTVWAEDGYGPTSSVSFVVAKCDVFVLSGGNALSDKAVSDALIARGHTPKLGVEAWLYNGAQPRLQDFDLVVLLNNHDWASPGMSVTAQEALLKYVSQGGGLVTAEWLVWNANEGKVNTLSPMIPAIAESYGSASSSTYVQAEPDPIINNGLPGSFTFALNNIDGSESFLEPKEGATVFYGRGLIGWKYQAGRVISFSTLLSEVELADSNYARLFGNAAEWTANVHRKQIDFTMADGGGVSFQTSGRLGTTSRGYAAIQPSNGSATPSGLAILGLRQNDVLVSETAVPASPLIRSGRIYAEVNGSVNTGLAIANPHDEPAIVSFYFTDENGDFGHGTTTIPANGQIAAFVDEAPFNASDPVNGALTLDSSLPVAVFAARGLTNERSEFLATSLPVVDLQAPASQETAVFPHFAEGGGWTTEFLLVNPTNSELVGTIEFRNQRGDRLPLVLSDQWPTVFPTTVMRYFVPAQGSQKLRILSDVSSSQTGSVRLFPEPNTPAPAGVAVLSLSSDGVTFASSGIPAVTEGSAFRLYAESSGDFIHSEISAIETGVVVTNSSPSLANVSLDLDTLDGSSTGLSGILSIPGNGQVALFLRQIPGFDSLPTDFRGVLRVSGPSSLSVTGVRGRYNERKDFLFTVIPALDEAAAPPTGPLYFPHIADSGGYTTQFILFSGQPGPPSSGAIQLFDQTGGALYLTLQ